MVQKEDPDFVENRNFWWDALNVAIGIVWQLQLMIVPICLVIRKFDTMWLSLGVLVVTSVVMKFTWYDRLGDSDGFLDQPKRAA